MLLGRARDGSVRVSESEGERIDAGQHAWQRIVTCLAVFFLPKIEPGRLPMLDPVVAPPMFGVPTPQLIFFLSIHDGALEKA
jgi:hypothetical protein